MPRVYLHSIQRGEFWCVGYLDTDLKTSVGRVFHYPSLDSVRVILTRANADAAAREDFESGLRKWGIGACFLTLTEAQYKKLLGAVC
jgi:hypothetical protein